MLFSYSYENVYFLCRKIERLLPASNISSKTNKRQIYQNPDNDPSYQNSDSQFPHRSFTMKSENSAVIDSPQSTNFGGDYYDDAKSKEKQTLPYANENFQKGLCSVIHTPEMV